MMRLTVARATLAASLALAFALPASAESVTAAAGLQGWVSSNGASNEAQPMGNTYTGNEFGSRFNSWAAFFIPAGTTWNSATLSLAPSAYGDAPPSVIGIFDFTAGLDPLLNTFHPGTDVYSDLGSGAQYGSVTAYDSPLTFNLNGAALGDINASAGSYFVIGFTNQTLNALPSPEDGGSGIYMGGIGPGGAPIELTLSTVAAVPEPATYGMMLAGLALVGATARRRRSQA